MNTNASRSIKSSSKVVYRDEISRLIGKCSNKNNKDIVFGLVKSFQLENYLLAGDGGFRGIN